MSTRLLILPFLLILISSAVGASASADIQHYAIAIDVDVENNIVNGSTIVSLKSSELEKLGLELDEDLKITSVAMNGKDLGYFRSGKKIEIEFERPLNGEIEILFLFQGSLEERVSGHSWAYMDFESVYAVYESSWYPNIPRDRAKADIIITAPFNWTAISNGELKNYDEKTNAYHWKVDTEEIGFSFASGRYFEDREYKKHIPISCFLSSPKDKCAEKLRDTLEFFSEQLTPYPYPKLAMVEVKGALNGGHGDNALIILSSDVIKGERFDEFLAHEVVHNWFGGIVTAADSKWITEGFATYLGLMYLERVDPEQAKVSLKNMRKEYLSMKNKGNDRPIILSKSEYDDLFHATVYSKGAYVLHMLRYVIGDEVFQKTIKTFLQNYEQRSAGVQEFRKVSESTSGMELEWFFDQWLNSTIVPDFWIDSVEVENTKDGYFVTGVLKQGERHLKTPVDIAIITSREEKEQRVWVEKENTEFRFQTKYNPIMLEINRDGWILEKNIFNNRHVIRYPSNLFGLKLLLSQFNLKIKSLF